jgi:hypothetical protein
VVVQGQHGHGAAKSGDGKGSAEQCAAQRASVRPRGGATSAQWLGEQAEARARQGLPDSGRGSSGSGELVGRSGLQAGTQAHMVLGEDWVCSGGNGVWQSTKRVVGCQWRGGGGLGVTRGEEAAAFKAGREAVRLLPCVPR